MPVDAEAGPRELERERQADVAEADHAAAGLAAPILSISSCMRSPPAVLLDVAEVLEALLDLGLFLVGVAESSSGRGRPGRVDRSGGRSAMVCSPLGSAISHAASAARSARSWRVQVATDEHGLGLGAAPAACTQVSSCRPQVKLNRHCQSRPAKRTMPLARSDVRGSRRAGASNAVLIERGRRMR